MSVGIDVYSWPAVVLAPGQELTLEHWIVDRNGNSIIDPENWYTMSAVPDYTDVRPDRPLPGASIQIVAQGGTRAPADRPGRNTTNWLVTWRNPSAASFVTFRARMAAAAAL
jgi:hypothetical protein